MDDNALHDGFSYLSWWIQVTMITKLLRYRKISLCFHYTNFGLAGVHSLNGGFSEPKNILLCSAWYQ